jgi:pilus assembly protein Flp/PilA
MMKRYNEISTKTALALGASSLPSLRREEGQTLTEYALILALVAIVLVGAIGFLTGNIQTLFSDIGSKL